MAITRTKRIRNNRKTIRGGARTAYETLDMIIYDDTSNAQSIVAFIDKHVGLFTPDVIITNFTKARHVYGEYDEKQRFLNPYRLFDNNIVACINCVDRIANILWRLIIEDMHLDKRPHIEDKRVFLNKHEDLTKLIDRLFTSSRLPFFTCLFILLRTKLDIVMIAMNEGTKIYDRHYLMQRVVDLLREHYKDDTDFADFAEICAGITQTYEHIFEMHEQGIYHDCQSRFLYYHQNLMALHKAGISYAPPIMPNDICPHNEVTPDTPDSTQPSPPSSPTAVTPSPQNSDDEDSDSGFGSKGGTGIRNNATIREGKHKNILVSKNRGKPIRMNKTKKRRAKYTRKSRHSGSRRR